MSDLIDTLTPDTQEKVRQLLSLAQERYGYRLKVVSARRPCSEQARLYAQGRTAPGNIVTNAKGCMSWHTLGRAVDLAFVQPNPSPQDWENLGTLGESLGFIWGKRFGPQLNDLPHFEYHPGVKIEQICKNPDDCEAGVAASMGVEPTSEGESLVPYIAIVVSSAVIAWALWELHHVCNGIQGLQPPRTRADAAGHLLRAKERRRLRLLPEPAWRGAGPGGQLARPVDAAPEQDRGCKHHYRSSTPAW